MARIGGSGKSIVVGTLARSFGENGYDVLAIDDDDDPNLSVSLGVPRETDVPPLPNDLVADIARPEARPDWELTTAPRKVVDDYGVEAPDGVALLRSGEVTSRRRVTPAIPRRSRLTSV